MKIETFEDIVAWQKARELTVRIYGSFENNRDFGFNDQIRRAAVSIMNNIAEGFERHSDREFKQSLYVAKGSAAEIRSMLRLASDLKYLNDEIFSSLHEKSREISRILSGLIKSLDIKEPPKKQIDPQF
jgi:four helix bundle protein